MKGAVIENRLWHLSASTKGVAGGYSDKQGMRIQ